MEAGDGLLAIAVLAGIALILAPLLVRASAARTARSRLFEADEPARPDVTLERGPLGRWLARAGYRAPGAAAVFVGATLIGIAVGAAFAVSFFLFNVPQRLIEGLSPLGVVGDVLFPAAVFAPWIAVGLFGAAPLLLVRAARRKRVQLIEQDLPIALELMATLGQSGLAFDTAVGRIVQSRLGDRPLAEELRRFQADVVSGRPRVESLRRMARRVEVSGVSIVVSALVQAEQLGMGIADVLRTQADDLRSRRRERANAFATSLSVKLLFPLVICFLPGIFVWTLGPVFIQLFQISDSLLRTRGGF